MLKLSKDRNTKVPHSYHTEQRYFSILIIANILPFNFLGLLMLVDNYHAIRLNFNNLNYIAL